jgi:hypothetical protein
LIQRERRMVRAPAVRLRNKDGLSKAGRLSGSCGSRRTGLPFVIVSAIRGTLAPASRRPFQKQVHGDPGGPAARLAVEQHRRDAFFNNAMKLCRRG